MNNSIYTIQPEDVQAVLQSIRYAKPLPKSPLHNYLIGKGILSDNMPCQLQDYHVIRWLTKIIETQYNACRCYHGLPMLFSDMPKKHLISNLRDDYMLSNSELESWSVIFTQYVCLSADISTNEHAQIAQMTKRTLRRRQKQGIELVYLQILIS